MLNEIPNNKFKMGKENKITTFSCIILLIYIFTIIFNLFHHELWGDEFHSWNIVKASSSIIDLFHNIRYEGHPPFWYILLFIFSKFSHSLIGLKLFQFGFALLTSSLILFYSPFSRITKVLLLFGYYFIYEYGIFARNYMPAIFFSFCIAIIFSKSFRYKNLTYYTLLVLLSNVHLLGIFLAISLHCAYCYDKKSNLPVFIKHLFVGFLLILPSAYFIFPPNDSELNLEFWARMWSEEKFFLIKKVIVESFFPYPDFSKFNWWNTHILTDNSNYIILTRFIFVSVLFVIYLTFRKSKTALILLTVNFLLTYLFSLIFPLSTARYVGFMFISFILAAWISEFKFDRLSKIIFSLFLIIQIPAGIMASRLDYNQKFSNAADVIEIEKKIPAEYKKVTDYWCLNILSAYLDKSFYILELKKESSFLVWNSEMNVTMNYNYAIGINDFLTKNQSQPFYLFSTHTASEILKNYSGENIKLQQVDESSGAIEPSGNVYLYLVSRK